MENVSRDNEPALIPKATHIDRKRVVLGYKLDGHEFKLQSRTAYQKWQTVRL